MRKSSRSRRERGASGRRRISYLRGKLLEKRRRALDALESELKAPLESSGHALTDPADMACSSLDHETCYAIGSVESAAVADIDHALERLAEGTYGICEECGQRIPDARLRAVPSASLCVRCKETAERAEEAEEAEGELPWESIGGFSVEDGLDVAGGFGSVKARRPG